MKTKCCPICGSTNLVMPIFTCVKQDTDGEWRIVVPNKDDLEYALDNKNNEVQCNNEFCGNPIDGLTGVLINIPDNIPHEDYLKSYYDQNYSEDVISFDEWMSELHYDSWHGVLDECVEI